MGEKEEGKNRSQHKSFLNYLLTFLFLEGRICCVFHCFKNKILIKYFSHAHHRLASFFTHKRITEDRRGSLEILCERSLGIASISFAPFAGGARTWTSRDRSFVWACAILSDPRRSPVACVVRSSAILRRSKKMLARCLWIRCCA